MAKIIKLDNSEALRQSQLKRALEEQKKAEEIIENTKKTNLFDDSDEK